MQILKLSKTKEKFSHKTIESFNPKIFARESTVVYSGQVPNIALLLLKGTAVVGADKVLVKNEDEMFLIGFTELLKKSPTSSDVKILKGAEVVIFDQDTSLCEALNSWRFKK